MPLQLGAPQKRPGSFKKLFTEMLHGTNVDHHGANTVSIRTFHRQDYQYVGHRLAKSHLSRDNDKEKKTGSATSYNFECTKLYDCYYVLSI